MSSLFDIRPKATDLINSAIKTHSHRRMHINISGTIKEIIDAVTEKDVPYLLLSDYSKIPLRDIPDAEIYKSPDFVGLIADKIDEICKPNKTHEKKLLKSRLRAQDFAKVYLSICNNNELIITLDGNLDNVAQFIKCGVRPENIIVVEMVEEVAITRRIIVPYGVRVIYCDLYSYLKNESYIAERVGAIYFDATGNIQCNAKRVFLLCQNLRLYGITRNWRTGNGKLGYDAKLSLRNFTLCTTGYYDHGTVECWM